MPDFSEQQPAKPAFDSRTLGALQNEIDSYGKDQQSESLLGKAVSKVTHAFWHKDEDALANLQSLRDEAARKRASGDTAGLQSMELQINQSIKTSQDARTTEQEISQYGSGFVKTAGLFMRGPVGIAGTVLLYGADQAKADGHMGRDFALGMVKGGATKGLFEILGKSEMSVGLKGATLGFSSRVLDLGLSADTYKNGLGDGAQRILSGAANPLALTGDVIAFGAGSKLMGLTEGTSLANSKMLGTMLTGGAFGLSSGASGEILKETAEGKGYKFNKIFHSGSLSASLGEFVKETGEYDFRKVASHALIQGALDTVAAAPGGIQADANFRGGASRFLQDRATDLRWQVSDFKTRALNLADSIDLGLGPQFATAGGPAIGRLPVEGLRRPARPAEASGAVMMSDGSSLFNKPGASGANLDGVLSGARSEVPRIEKPVAAAVPETAPRDSSRIQVRTPQEKADFESFLDRVNANAVTGEPGKGQVFDFLKAHPELEGPIRQYAGQAFSKVTSAAVQQFSPEDVRSLRTQIAWIDQFYKSGSPLLVVDSGDMALKFQQFTYLAKPFQDGKGSLDARDALSMYLGTNPDMHPLIKQFAAAYSNEGVVAELDRYFNTKNLDSIKERQQWRASSPAGTDSTSTTAATAPDADGKAPPVVREPDATTQPPKPEVAPGQPAAGDGSPPADASGRKGTFDPAMVNQSAHAQDLALGLESPDITVRGPIVRRLADHLEKLTDDEFRTWMKVAPDGINRAGLILSRPELQEMNPAVLKEFLTKSGPDQPPPEWTKPFIEENILREQQKAEQAKQQAEQARAEGRPFRPYKPPRPPRPFDDSITNRLSLLENVLNTFKGEPKLAERLLELGAADKPAVDFIVDTVGREGIGPAHKTLLENSLPNASSIEPIKYLFQFVKERNESGAYTAAMLAKPAGAPSMADLEAEIRAEAYEKGEDLEDHEVPERAALLEESMNDAAAKKWENSQNLIHDLVIGKIRMPPKPFAPRGGPRGGPPGQGNPGGFRGNNSGGGNGP